MEAGRLGGYDVVMLDTAGRVTVDEALMDEAAEVARAVDAHEVLLVADALTGQDAVNTARAFDERMGLTGIVLTRMDGDSRGGAALSMRAVTGKPIKLIGTARRSMRWRSSTPRAWPTAFSAWATSSRWSRRRRNRSTRKRPCASPEKMRKGKFDLADLRNQLAQMEKLGGVGGLMGMMPGMGAMKKQLEGANVDDKVIKRQCAIIDSMTPKERRSPDILKASRKKRIAAGAGMKVEDVNKLLKMHRQMADMMKQMGKNKRGGIAGALGSIVRPRRWRHARRDSGWHARRYAESEPGNARTGQRSRWAGQLPPGMGGGGIPPMPPDLAGGKGGGKKDTPSLPGLGGGSGGPKLPGLGLPFGGGKKK